MFAVIVAYGGAIVVGILGAMVFKYFLRRAEFKGEVK